MIVELKQSTGVLTMILNKLFIKQDTAIKKTHKKTVLLTAIAILFCLAVSSSAALASSRRTRSILAFVRTCQLESKYNKTMIIYLQLGSEAEPGI